MKGRTVLTIAHRLSTIRKASQIAVLERGQVVELGAYEALMSIPPNQLLTELKVFNVLGFSCSFMALSHPGGKMPYLL